MMMRCKVDKDENLAHLQLHNLSSFCTVERGVLDPDHLEEGKGRRLCSRNRKSLSHNIRCYCHSLCREAYTKILAIEPWENTKSATIEADLKQIEADCRHRN
uniref:Uncharacterized protein n=1 Tax=Tanacetum cinerariifolium TaxID=118510 RepID=A0A699IXG9_TANCI|nr:hypothetical protein [Tanacetum cinerariifolium]